MTHGKSAFAGHLFYDSIANSSGIGALRDLVQLIQSNPLSERVPRIRLNASANNAPESPEAPVLLNPLGTMRRRPRASYPVESVTLDIDQEVTALRGPERAGRVLLLEDRDDFRQVLHDHLVFRSYEVTSVPSGVEGLREIMKGVFDLIICDMMMPQVGGEMFYWAVTRIRPAAAQRFIFFTGHQNNRAIEFFFRRVNATVLFKPFTLKALDSAIQDVFLKLR
jgi:CheY-like chemotaxis protein